MVSISSMNTMQGAFSLACLNRSRTLAAPRPTNISTNSEPEMEKNGTPASPATAFARRVLPVPGGPTSRAPRGDLARISWSRLGFSRKSTTSLRDYLGLLLAGHVLERDAHVLGGNDTGAGLAKVAPADTAEAAAGEIMEAAVVTQFRLLHAPVGPPTPAGRR